MKYLSILLFAIILCCSSCDDDDCVAGTAPTCQETPPTNELCQAFFTRWFYNADTGKCEEIGYSGCSQVGFDTETECLSCICID